MNVNQRPFSSPHLRCGTATPPRPATNEWDRALAEERVIAAYDYWSGKRTASRLPGRADLDPIEFPALLPFVGLVEVAQAPWRFRYRLVGTGVVEMYNRDFTGLTLPAQGPDGTPPAWPPLWRAAVETAAPAAGWGSYRYADGWQAGFAWCVLPLASDGRHIDMLFQIEAPYAVPSLDGGIPDVAIEGGPAMAG